MNGDSVMVYYDTATAPFKHLSNNDFIEKKHFEKLVYVYKSLDPVLLLKQIKTLQDALWKHAVLRWYGRDGHSEKHGI